jgi:hypothetical protein
MKCRDCLYWTGSPGNNPSDLLCAVSYPVPVSLSELEKVDGRLASVENLCSDWRAK